MKVNIGIPEMLLVLLLSKVGFKMTLFLSEYLLLYLEKDLTLLLLILLFVVGEEWSSLTSVFTWIWSWARLSKAAGRGSKS